MAKNIAPIAASARNIASKSKKSHDFKAVPSVTGEVVTVKSVEGRFGTQTRVALRGAKGEATICFLPDGWGSLAAHIGEKVTIAREVTGDDFEGYTVNWTAKVV